jgi:hypothetical protein
MKITVKWLEKNNACNDGIKLFQSIFGDSAELKEVINYNIKNKSSIEYQYCNWILIKKMNHDQRIKYAIFAAERVLYIFENSYPDDNRPRNAIKAAKKYLKNKSAKNQIAAYEAYTAADAAADATAGAATAYAAAYAAHAAHAAYAAAHAAYAAAYEAYTADATMKVKILKYGLKLLEGK